MITKYGSVYDKFAFTVESKIGFLRAKLVQREKMFKNEINFLTQEITFNR